MPLKLNISRKKSTAKFLSVQNPEKFVTTSLLSLTVDRQIAGDVPIYLQFALKVTHPFRQRRFRQILLVPQTKLAKEVQLLLTDH